MPLLGPDGSGCDQDQSDPDTKDMRDKHRKQGGVYRTGCDDGGGGRLDDCQRRKQACGVQHGAY